MMKNKFLMFLLVTAFLCSVFIGCNDNKDGSDTESTSNATITTTQPSTEASGESLPNTDNITYAEYSSLTAEEQKEIMDSFETVNDFFDWYEEKKEEHKEQPDEPIFPQATDVTAPSKDKVTYLDYEAMSGKEQMAYINSFGTIEAFVEWYNDALDEYKNGLIEYDGTTPVDAGDLLDKIGGN